jgi:hypothetical protein
MVFSCTVQIQRSQALVVPQRRHIWCASSPWKENRKNESELLASANRKRKRVGCLLKRSIIDGRKPISVEIVLVATKASSQ